MPRGVLALDLGTMCGWAKRDRQGQVTHGRALFQPPSHRPNTFKFYSFLTFLARQHKEAPIDHVYYELVHFQNQRNGFLAAQNFGGFEGVLTAWCELRSVDYDSVAPATLKKFVTGTGRAKKPDMVAAVTALGFKIRAGRGSEDEADAIAILRYFEQVVEPVLSRS